MLPTPPDRWRHGSSSSFERCATPSPYRSRSSSRRTTPRSGSSPELRLPLRWIAILAGQVDGSLAASTGVHRVDDVVKVLLAGADVAMSTSALLEHGAMHLTTLRTGLEGWLAEHEYDSVAELRGSVSRRSVPDPDLYERAQYARVLHRTTDAFL